MTKFKHCFVIENGTYREISYTTLYIGKERNPEYAGRYFLPIHGCLMEVPYEEYKREYQLRRRCKYIQEEAKLNGEVSYHALESEDINGEEILKDLHTDVESEAIDLMIRRALCQALKELTEAELELIEALYYRGMTERQYAGNKGVMHNAVHKRKMRILAKLKKIIEKNKI
jgi:RNA polymerase sigma factor (sigma-70 family)